MSKKLIVDRNNLKIANLNMLEEQKNISHLQIIECLKNDCGIKVKKLTYLPLGADVNASVYKADKDYFVKLKRGSLQDIGVMGLLHEEGIKGIIPPIKTVYIDDFTLIVYPFIEGQNGFSSDLRDDQWVELGETMRQIHEIKVPLEIQKQIRREAYSPKWREIVKGLFTLKETYDDDLMRYMKEHEGAIFRLVERAEELGKIVKGQFVLCHSDIHGGNVLLNDKIYIVDWDDPIMAPKERDLMFIGGGVANVWNKPHEIELFYKGYGATKIDGTLLAYYRHERIVEDIAVYGQELLMSKDGGDNRQVMFNDFVGMFEPQGVVDIAFKTDIF